MKKEVKRQMTEKAPEDYALESFIILLVFL